MTAREGSARRDELLEPAFEAAGVGLCLVAPDGTICRANAEWLRSTCLTAKQALGKTILGLFPETRDLTLALHARARAGEQVQVPRHSQRIAGRETWWDGAIAPVAMEGGTGLLITAREVTAEVVREREVGRAGERLQNTLDAIAAGYYELDADWCFLALNRATERHFGRTASELIGHNLWEVGGDPADSPVRRRFEQARLSARPDHFEAESQVNPGSWADVHVRPVGDILCVYFSDISEHKRAEQALREANRRLVDADRRKTEFLAMLSHELRNPLAPARAALWLLERSEPGSAQAQRAHEILDRQMLHLTRIVDDLLDVTHIIRGRVEIRRSRLDLNELVRQTVDDHGHLFAAAELSLDLRLSPRPLWVDADATRIAQAVGNLLSNAAKFSIPGGRVTVTSERQDHAALVSVADEGIGIAADLLPAIFEPFTQGEAGLDRSRGGLGLGLSLVKGLMELHGGSVEARSDGPGCGAELRLRLPLALGAPPAERPSASPQTVPCRKVLVIEDNIDAAQTLREVLVRKGHEVEVRHDGRSGLEKARAFRPDVVFCDIGLPQMNGYEVARAFRRDPALRPTFLVALTGYAATEDLGQALEAGFDQHLPKPASVEAMEAALAAAGFEPPADG